MSSEISFSDSLNKFKESFLWAAAQGGNTEDCESLLEIGAQVDWKNVDGDTALLSACRRGHTDTVVLLLVYGANPNMRARDGLTPLHICTLNGDIKTINVLLDAGADASLLSDNEEKCLDVAKRKGFESIVRRLSLIQTHTVNNESNLDTGNGNRVIDENAYRAEGRPTTRSVARTITPLLPTDSIMRSRLSESLTSSSIVGSDAPLSPSYNVFVDEAIEPNVTGEHLNTKHSKKKNATLPNRGLKQTYSLIAADKNDKNAASDFTKDEQYQALCRQLDAEHRIKKVLEAQVESMKHKLLEFDIIVSKLNQQLSQTEVQLSARTTELDGYKGIGIDSFNLSQCEDYERKLKISLDAISIRKAKIIQEELGQQKEQRMCVICQIEEKSVVLFPCRHMCLCDGCASHEDLQNCPLCRRVIVQRVSVFS